MGIKKSGLKKFLVKDLKKIIKENKLGKVSKKTKPQLIAMILESAESRDILSKLSMPVKKKKKFSKKQLEAQARFKAMVAKPKAKPEAEKAPEPIQPKAKARPGVKTFDPRKSETKEMKEERIALGSLPTSELKDIAQDKGLKFPSDIGHEDLVRLIMFGKFRAKDMGDKQIKTEKSFPIKSNKKKAALKEINDMMSNMIKVKEEQISNQKVIKKIGKKKFLDAIFGVSKFNLRQEIRDVMNEANEEQLDIFLSFTKDKKREVLERRFNQSKSIGQLLKTFIK